MAPENKIGIKEVKYLYPENYTVSMKEAEVDK